MTETDQNDKTVSKLRNTPGKAYGKTKSGFSKIVYEVKASIATFRNQNPAYIITENGIETHWFDFSDPKNLPFDLQTYYECQIFLGDWGNPWEFKLDKITENYEEFDYYDDNLFDENHVIPSQQYKTYMGQRVLSDMFVGARLDEEKLIRILYAIGAGVGFVIVLLVGGVL